MDAMAQAGKRENSMVECRMITVAQVGNGKGIAAEDAGAQVA